MGAPGSHLAAATGTSDRRETPEAARAGPRGGRVKKQKLWSYSVGRRGARITVVELKPGGMLYGRSWNPRARDGKGAMYRRSLGHRDKEAAIRWAADQHKELLDGEADRINDRVTLGRLLASYLTCKTPNKVLTEQAVDHRRAELFNRVWGRSLRARDLNEADWDAFIAARRRGTIDARGNRLPEGKRRPVRNRAIEADLKFVRSVLRYGVKRKLLKTDPLAGCVLPEVARPRREFAKRDRYLQTRAVTDAITMVLTWGGERRHVRSWLTELLDVVNYSIRRISAVRQLRLDDLLTGAGEHGALRWRAETDKLRVETVTPIGPEIRAALDRQAERVGEASEYFFPSPSDPTQPVARELCDTWLREAERLAGLPKLNGTLWHAYRRGGATAYMNAGVPNKVTCALGGWTSARTLEDRYQKVTFEAMQRGQAEARKVGW